MTTVLVAGFTGAMGQKAVAMITADPDLELVGVYNPHVTSLQPSDYGLAESVGVYNAFTQITVMADIWLDFSVPTGVYANAKFAIERGMRPVIGTSGLPEDQQVALQAAANARHLGGVIAANFGVTAVLMMKFAREAAAYLDDAEIIEYHHEDKLDAPSGTALNTAKLIYQQQGHDEPRNPQEQDPLGARGGDYHGIKIHAVRLPGFIADEEVIFGGSGETLTIKQSTTDRASFMKGVRLGIDAAMNRQDLVIGLENIL
ncbi:4-hydroxy-tetrahydrodipicolinate reductase [Levilactobacillus cerevisiae]|uniref:4-hydroxy-tetrahydrodipicolinate reductase n=1 Tax=Levilactobacillus cerevisiae TaxID=1704076 RepID=UPI000F779139|nr:4-hydroxy-tetrahydrodipicolinate reductase [Levilactobacillus cerevisiae]